MEGEDADDDERPGKVDDESAGLDKVPLLVGDDKSDDELDDDDDDAEEDDCLVESRII